MCPSDAPSLLVIATKFKAGNAVEEEGKGEST